METALALGAAIRQCPLVANGKGELAHRVRGSRVVELQFILVWASVHCSLYWFGLIYGRSIPSLLSAA
jgi:hypothetical protein